MLVVITRRQFKPHHTKPLSYAQLKTTFNTFTELSVEQNNETVIFNRRLSFISY